jgi:hypothetical protein
MIAPMWDGSGIEIWRGGETNKHAKQCELKPRQLPKIVAGFPVGETEEGYQNGVTVRFVVSNSGGKSRFYVWLSPEVFGQIATAMIKANQKTAETAFLSAMLEKREPRS